MFKTRRDLIFYSIKARQKFDREMCLYEFEDTGSMDGRIV